MNPKQLKIGFIGGGNMARAIVAGLLRSGHPSDRLRIGDPNKEQRRLMADLDPNLALYADNEPVARDANVLVLAVKPQVMAEVLNLLGPRPAGQLILSIAAGIALEQLHEWLGDEAAIVRSMPNQPAAVGAGMAALVANENVSESQREQAEYVMAATGQAGWVTQEDLIDSVTAISGSGPAYFYLLMEIMEDCARELGIPASLARQLAVETGYGAGLAAREIAKSPESLRSSVTSPGGTTAAAIETLEEAGLRDIVRAAIKAAHRRSLELGQ